MGSKSTALFLIGLGAALVVLGLVVWTGAFRWFGRLPGDIRIEREHTRIYFPITSMVVVSLVLTLVLNVIRRWL